MGREQLRKGLFVAAVLILVLVMIYSGLQIMESTVFRSEDSSDYVSKTVVRDGIEYYPRSDVTVVMLLGIDDEGPARDSGTYNNTGGADMVTLLIFDEKKQQCDLLVLNRDSMVEMPVLGLTGKQAGTDYGQLALSHTYGSGLEDSCVNTRTTVSDMLHGIRIDHYVSLHMDGIGILNDAVGGVEVTIQDDFSAVDPTLVQGQTIRLDAKQAMSFVRSRQGVGSGLNISRMGRHEQYMRSFVTQLKDQLANNPLYASQLLSQVSDYTVTDCSTTELNRLAKNYGDYPIGQVYTPEGENKFGGQYYEFHLDQEALTDLTLELFFQEKTKAVS